MGQFTGNADLRHLDDGILAILLVPLYYQDEELGLISAPANMLTDGGSIPKLFQNVISPWGRGLKGFIIHDALYKFQWFTRAESDQCLWRMLKDLNDPSLEANVIYDAVRLGGQKHWDIATQEKEKNKS